MHALTLVQELRKGKRLPTAAHYSRLVAQLCLKRKFGEARQLFFDIEGSEGLELDEDAMGLLVSESCKSGEALLGAQLLDIMLQRAQQPRVATWSLVVSRLGQSSETAAQALTIFHRCRDLFRSLEVGKLSPKADLYAYNAALNAAITIGDLGKTEQLLQDLHNDGFLPDTVTSNIILKGHAARGETGKALGMKNQMTTAGLEPDVATYNSMISIHVALKDFSSAERLIEDMRHKGPTCQPNVRSYTIILKGYVEAGRMASAMQLLRKMQESCRDSCPNEVTYSIIIDGCVKAGRMDIAKNFLREMADKGVPANAVTYNSLLRGYCRAKQLASAYTLIEDMRAANVDPTAATFNTLIDGCVRCEDGAAALDAFRHMRQAGLFPSVISYTTLIKAFGRNGQPRLAARVFEEMSKDGKVSVDRAAWSALIDAHSRAGRMAEATELLEKMKCAGFRPSLATYGSLVRGHAKRGTAAEALLLWREIEQRMKERQHGGGWKQASEEDLVPDEALFDSLVDACVRAGYFARALEIVACMEGAGIPADKLKYKRTFIELYSDLYPKAITEAATPQSGERALEWARHLEQFKFWLGLPNDYYRREWDWRT
eukprot:SM000118S25617  [mRNA]  locus=s118:289931:294469:- [translate_table: standard]